MFLPRTSNRLWLAIVATHACLIVFVHVCGYYSRAATVSFAELQVRLLYSSVATSQSAASI